MIRPDDVERKLSKIVAYLKGGGCSKIFLFGYYADGAHRENSDIDIAVSGISNKRFFNAVADLPLVAQHPVDLVDLDDLPPKYRASIEKNGVVLYAN